MSRDKNMEQDRNAAVSIGGRDADTRGADGRQAVQESIGRVLRSHFRDLAEMPLPHDLRRLMVELSVRESTAEPETR